MIRDGEQAPAVAPLRVLGLRDIVFFTVVAVTGLRWITRGARAGAPAILLWGLAWLTFFVPLALAVSVLAKKYPEQGGIYAWVHRAFGPVSSALCGWCLWVNNLFYFPALLLFAAANAAAMFGDLRTEAARASLTRRARRSGSYSNEDGRNLRATSRPRRVSSARKTSPIPPRPSRSPTL